MQAKAVYLKSKQPGNIMLISNPVTRKGILFADIILGNYLKVCRTKELLGS